jgi:hypothetical protein
MVVCLSDTLGQATAHGTGPDTIARDLTLLIIYLVCHRYPDSYLSKTGRNEHETTKDFQ